ncbi:hypothetical protein ACG04Q_21560 [Roseateles sp. DXS20W]|uniref:Uncharacterized protein n=1 Tax=Pelomonas lactea TaxID=3299030 RepID=A0ABW7GQS3_9BURK
MDKLTTKDSEYLLIGLFKPAASPVEKAKPDQESFNVGAHGVAFDAPPSQGNIREKECRHPHRMSRMVHDDGNTRYVEVPWLKARDGWDAASVKRLFNAAQILARRNEGRSDERGAWHAVSKSTFEDYGGKMHLACIQTVSVT